MGLPTLGLLAGILSKSIEPSILLVGYSSLSFVACLSTWYAFHASLAKTPTGVFGVFLLLTLFELGLGGYMATIATLKAIWVPDEMRATLYNLFRVPLNSIVVVINVVSLSSQFTFLACSVLMAVALGGSIAIHVLAAARNSSAKASATAQTLL